MRITKKEVKTLASIELNVADLMEVYEDAKAEPFKYVTTVGKPFDFMKDSPTIEDFKKAMEEWVCLSVLSSCEAIAIFYGFDGVENTGYYNKRSRCLRICVYTCGADL